MEEGTTLPSGDVRSRAEERILAAPSFWALSPDEQTLVRACARMEIPLPESLDTKALSEVEKQSKIALRAPYLKRHTLAESITYSRELFKRIPPPSCILDDADVAFWEGELELATYFALAQYVVYSSEHEREKDHDILSKRENTSTLSDRKAALYEIINLRLALQHRKDYGRTSSYESNPMPAGDPDYPLRYFGMRYIVPAVERAVAAISVDHLANQIDIPASFNGLRLYLVWANNLARCICDVIARNAQVALVVTEGTLFKLAIATGSLGFILYFARLAAKGSLLLQNSLDLRGTCFESFGIRGDVAALNLPWYDRFKTQWHERKFVILNDGIWGVVNLICFFWLVGKNILGFWGDALTGVLLPLDLWLTNWKFEEAKTMNQELQARDKIFISDLMKQIEYLKTKLGSKKPETQTERDEQSKLALLERELIEHTKAQRKRKRVWDYKLKQHVLDWKYGAMIIMAFAVLACFFIPPLWFAPLASLMFGLVGSAMCFGLGVIHKTWSGELATEMEQEKLDQDAIIDYENYLTLFKEKVAALKSMEATSGDSAFKSKLELDLQSIYQCLKGTVATKEEQKQAVVYQNAQMYVGLLNDLVLPTLFLLAFVFMPLGIGMPIFAVGLLVLFYANWQVAEMAPEGQKLGMFASLDAFYDWFFLVKASESNALAVDDKDDYKDFCQCIERGNDPTELLLKQLEQKKPLAPPTDEPCPDAA